MCIADAIELYKQYHNNLVDIKEVKRLYYRDIDVTLEEIKEELENE